MYIMLLLVLGLNCNELKFRWVINYGLVLASTRMVTNDASTISN